MFPKSAIVFKVQELDKLASVTEERLEQYAFAPCTGAEALSQGFSKVQDVFSYNYSGFRLLQFTIQKKTVPASAVKARVQEVCQQMNDANGHWPGRKATKEVKLAVVDELLARAIPSTKTHNIFIDNATGYVTIDTTSNGVVTAVLSHLYQVGEIQVEAVKFPGRAAMTRWLQYDSEEGELIPSSLTADDTVVFEHPGNTGKTVKYERANLSDTDVTGNIEAGAEVLSLALTYDHKVSFVLKDGTLGRIRTLGVLNEKPPANKEDAFQSAFYLAASEMTDLTNYLKEVA